MASKTELDTVNTVKQALGSVDDFGQLLAYLKANDIPLENVEDYGDGVKLTPKEQLIDKPLVIVEWVTKDSDEYGSTYTVARGMTQDGIKFAFADGSSGINRQLEEIALKRHEKGITGPAVRQALYVPRGLTVSKYSQDYTDEKTGEIKTRRAETFYLNI